MPDFDWKNAVQSIAPGIATALGGPAAGMAVSMLGRALLGKEDATEDELATAMGNGLTGDQIVAIKKGEQDFQLELAKLQQASEAAALADVADARKQTVELAKEASPIAWGAPIVSTLIVIGYFSCIYLLFFYGTALGDSTNQLLNNLFGALTLAFGSVVSYWLGSSAGSKRSSDVMRQIASKATVK